MFARAGENLFPGRHPNSLLHRNRPRQYPEAASNPRRLRKPGRTTLLTHVDRFGTLEPVRVVAFATRTATACSAPWQRRAGACLVSCSTAPGTDRVCTTNRVSAAVPSSHKGFTMSAQSMRVSHRLRFHLGVPEPTTAAMALFGTLCFLAGGRRGRAVPPGSRPRQRSSGSIARRPL